MGWSISVDIKRVALSMSFQGLSDSTIRQYTGISVRTMKWLRHEYRNNSFPAAPPLEIGRLHVLNAIQVKVCTHVLCPGSYLTST